MQQGTPVTITAIGLLGTLEGIGFRVWDSYIAEHGDTGEYWGVHPDLEDEDWHIIQLVTDVGVRYCPLHKNGFQPV